MSSYSLSVPPPPPQFGSHFDRVNSAYQASLQASKANFTVSHLLDLEELPGEDCSMFAATAPHHQSSPTQIHHHGTLSPQNHCNQPSPSANLNISSVSNNSNDDTADKNPGKPGFSF